MKSFNEITREMCDLYCKKNTDYGDVFDKSCDEFGLISPIIRLNDKVARLKSLNESGLTSKVDNEKIEDTLLDIANYAVMTLQWLSKQQ